MTNTTSISVEDYRKTANGSASKLNCFESNITGLNVSQDIDKEYTLSQEDLKKENQLDEEES